MSLMRHVQRASIIAAGSALCLAGLIAPLASAEETPAPEATSTPTPTPVAIEVGTITVSPSNIAQDEDVITISGTGCIGEGAEVFVYDTGADTQGLPVTVEADGTWSQVVYDGANDLYLILPGETVTFGATCFVGEDSGVYPPVTITVLTVGWDAGDVGTAVPTQGMGFTPGSTVTITLSGNGIEPVVVGTAAVDPDGSFASTFAVPETTEVGVYTLTFDDGAGRVFTYDFVVTYGDEEEPQDPVPPVAPGQMPDLGTDIV